MPEDTLPNFTDKVVTFYVADAPRGIEAGIAMEHVEFERLGDRLFAIGRVPGWCISILEQLDNNLLIRPLLRYEGPMDLQYVPIEQR